MELTLELAQQLIAQALAQAQSEFKRPICVAVCDAYGFLLAYARMPGVPIRSIAISQGKAHTAARIGTNTDAFLERLRREDLPASYFCDPLLTALPGGAVLKDSTGAIVGAAGISGLAPTDDQAVANAMAAAVQKA